MGDFFEMFFEDAEAASAALDIALTARGEHAGKKIAMCGVPVSTAELYLARLIRRGFRVAVAEQTETPATKSGKGPLKRAIVRLVTPGTLTEDALLDASRPNLLVALTATGARMGAAIADISTGSFETENFTLNDLGAVLGRLDPAELIADPAIDLGDFSSRRAPPIGAPSAASARTRLADAFGAASLDAFGVFSDEEAAAGILLLDYLQLTQAGQMPRLAPPSPRGAAASMAMDAATRASLEILKSRDASHDLTLFSAIARNLTAAGNRLLAEFLAAPLTDPAAIARRQDGWTWFLANTAILAKLRDALKSAPDMARILARLSLGRGSPRDLAGIRAGLHAASAAQQAFAGTEAAPLAGYLADLQLVPGLLTLLGRALAENPLLRLDDGGAIAAGYDAELDSQRRLRDESRQVIAALQQDFAQEFAVPQLKIKHHAQLGYVIEVPSFAVETLRARPELVLRQGMANGARFTHPKLSTLDQRINEAADRAAARERVIFAELVAASLGHATHLAKLAHALAELDVLQGAAKLAEGGSWCRPRIDDSDAFLITAGRHPVVEQALAGHIPFVPNDCNLSRERRILLLTGPNMAGKSTFLRQNALIAILAQSGLPVPAEAAHIGVVDRLFSRVGAADELARGRSTFMVEMTETAAILHQAGPRSLVIVDEIGRGTSTLDGLAIAWAVLESLHSVIRARTIFATHFHELARLTTSLPRLSPHMMRVREWRGEVVFLHEVATGAAGRSFGVQVAKLAGVPANVVTRATHLLSALERDRAPLIADLPLFAREAEKPAPPEDVITKLLDQCEPDTLSPREALDFLYQLKKHRVLKN
jgi:DNA mismatch repair protein MutS